jgi:uncharacterized phage protein gp47/JayE
MNIPIYADGSQTPETIMQRMLDKIDSDIDKSEGSYVWDSLAPAADELYEISLLCKYFFEQGFASTAASKIPGFYSEYLKKRALEHGVDQNEATFAIIANGIKFTGTAGTVVPSGTYISTEADEASDTEAKEFYTTNDCALNNDGVGYADIKAVKAGHIVLTAGTITVLSKSVDGITSVTNPAAIDAGEDLEEDTTYLSRYFARVRNPASSGNRADYVNWAEEVSGVGKACCVPHRDGAGTVSVAIVDSDYAAAGQDLIDAVQDHIGPPYAHTIEAEAMTLSGSGCTVDNTQTDDTNNSVKIVPDAADGVISHQLQELLDKPGIWQARVSIKGDPLTGADDLLEIGVYNDSTAAWCKTTPSGTVDAMATYTGANLAETFFKKIIQFYWNGDDSITFKCTRKLAETVTTVWVDLVTFRSTFSTDEGDGKAPAGPFITVESAKQKIINITSNIVLESGTDRNTFENSFSTAVQTYFKELTFAEKNRIKRNDVKYAKVTSILLDINGLSDYSNLLLNEAAANIYIGKQEIAVLGTVTFTYG